MTSIEWFIEQLEEHLLANDVVLQLKNTEAFEQSKEMHKQEIIDACIEFGNLNGVDIEDYEQYYQETFVSKGSHETLKD
jgi:hypothetical protein